MSHPDDLQRHLIRDFLAKAPKRPLIVIIGPTASGKTASSIALAEVLKAEGREVEIVNADSRQFYKYLDIGTAKITEKEMNGIPHHLLSVLDPKEDCSISWFQKEAMRVIDEIHGRGHLPMLVGGSMLYVSSVIDGLQPVASDQAIRDRLTKEWDADDGKALWERLTSTDPETAASIPKQNKVYVVRALEIFESTGQTKSSLKKTSESPYDLLMIGMDVPKEILNERINARTKEMLDGGWIDEVTSLLAKGYTVADPGMKSIGYREIAASLHPPHPRPLSQWERGDESRESGTSGVRGLLSDISAKTRQYAKRHQTWWKRDERVQWTTPIQD